VVTEDPLGHDLESARQLNDVVEPVFPPDATVGSIITWARTYMCFIVAPKRPAAAR
jgi:hypothetical protein